MTTIATIFSGAEGVGSGAQAAGIDHLWGLDDDDAIAQVARDNGFNVITADVTTTNPTQFQVPDILHASPPCPNFSSAKTGGVETSEDIALAQATVRFIETLMPRVFTLENVWGYHRSGSWHLIADALNRLGYWMTVQHLNSADFGVPQTRKRMIVRAVRGGWLPPLPPPVPWVGWYQAIEDLLPELPDSKFAPWQLERGVQDRINQTYILAQGSYDHTDDGNERDPQSLGKRGVGEPAFTVSANSNMLGMRAFIVSATGSAVTIRAADEPFSTVMASEKTMPPRAFIVDSQNARGTGVTIRRDTSPTFTVTANSGDKGMPRAAISGRVIRMTPRCLARFQSFPDDYVFSDKSTLAVRVIGNAVPPLWMQKILEPFNG